MTEPATLDATGTDLEPVPEPPHEPHALELAPRQRRSEVIRPLDTQALVESFAQYQTLLPQLLAAGDYQSTGTDRDGNEKRFVKKSGWRKIATAFDLDVQIIRSTIDRDENGQPLRAEVWARAIAPSGRAMDGDGYCSVDEERFGKPGQQEWQIAKARAKLENDLRATATTRAKNRAISDLVGMGEVSAEEITTSAQQAGPPFGDPVTPESTPRVMAALGFLLAAPETASEEDVHALWEKLAQDADGYFPKVVGRALLFVASAVKARLETPAEPEPEVPA
jgi:hypothetical protein